MCKICLNLARWAKCPECKRLPTKQLPQTPEERGVRNRERFLMRLKKGLRDHRMETTGHDQVDKAVIQAFGDWRTKHSTG